jgi:hypothetical protein
LCDARAGPVENGVFLVAHRTPLPVVNSVLFMFYLRTLLVAEAMYHSIIQPLMKNKLDTISNKAFMAKFDA